MSEDQAAPTTYDNDWLKPYLREIAAAGDDGFPSADSELWSTDEKPAKSIRQTMYIAKLARRGKDGALFLTEKGREFIAE